MIRKMLLAAIALVALVAAPAAAQYVEGVTIVIDDSTVDPGQTISLSGTCTGGDMVTFTLNGQTIGSAPVKPGATANDAGTYDATITLPDLPPGNYTIFATCGGEVAGVNITVTGGTPTTTPGNLSRTGSNTDDLVRLGAALLVGGGAVTLFATKRKRSHRGATPA